MLRGVKAAACSWTGDCAESVPIKRYGTAEKIAATVSFIAPDGADDITGQNIKADSGLMRGV